jgi:hypothetical protein
MKNMITKKTSARQRGAQSCRPPVAFFPGILIILFLVFQVPGVQGQLLDEPVINPSLLSYFQSEMTSVMDYQFTRKRAAPFYLGFGVNLTSMAEESSVTDREDSWLSTIMEGILLTQIKITDGFYIPLFIAGSWVSNHASLDKELTLGGRTMKPVFTDEASYGFFTGSGAVFKGRLFSGGILGGYYQMHDTSGYEGYFGGDWVKDSVSSDHPPFAVTFIPALHTSELKYLGKALSRVLGYVGMGDSIAVHTEEEQTDNKTAEAVVKALNYGIDLAFTTLRLSSSELSLNCFYRRDSYNSAAKANTYGAALGFSGKSWLLSAEGGYKQFYSVAKYFESQYPDTGFVNLALGFRMFGKDSYLAATYKYDLITKHFFGITMNMGWVNLMTKISNPEDIDNFSFDSALRWHAGVF